MIGVLLAALLDVRAQRLRTMAVMIGLGTAVASVMLVSAATVLSSRANQEYSEVTFGASATFFIHTSEAAQNFPPSQRAASRAEIEQLFSAMQWEHQSRFVSLPLTIVLPGRSQPVGTATWVSSSFPLISPVRLIAGTFPQQTAHGLVAHIVMSESLLRQLGLDPASAVGTVLRYGDSTTFRDAKQSPSWTMVIDAVASQLGPTQNPLDLVVVSDDTNIPGITSAGIGWLVTIPPMQRGTLEQLIAHVVASDGFTPLLAANRTDTGATIAPLLDQQELTGQIVALIVLIVAGLGLVGIGLAGTRERAQEFGLRRAIGVNRLRIFAGVVAQTVFEAALAGVFGMIVALVLVGFLARQLVLSQLPLPSNIDLPMESITIGMLAALLVGLIVSLLPAIRASRLSVVQALRD